MGWPTVRVGDIAEQIRGVTFGKSDARSTWEPGLVAVLTATNITEAGLETGSVLHIPLAKVAQRQMLRQNDLLITASSGSLSVVGRTVFVDKSVNATFGAFCKVLRPRPTVDARYLAHCFKTPEYRLTVSRLAAGANINNLRNEDLDNIAVPLPPLSEQRRISATLDHVDAIRADRTLARENLTGLLQAQFSKLEFGGARRLPLRELLVEIQSGFSPVSDSVPALAGQWGVLKLGAVSSGVYKPLENKALLPGTEPQPRHKVHEGDVLLARKNTPDLVGASAYVEHTPDNLLLPDLIFRLVPRAGVIESRFLQAALSTSSVRRAIRAMSGGSAASMSNVSKERLMSLPVIVPPLTEQQRYSAIAARVERLRAAEDAHLAKLDELFASLQYRAFRGEL